MKIQAREELKGLLRKLEHELEIALQERKKLDLSLPQNYNTFIRFYNSQKAMAQAQLIGSSSIIEVNAAPLVINQLKEKDREKLKNVMYYFDIVRDFLGGPEEDIIFSVAEHPIKMINQFEENFSSKEELKRYKRFFKERGRDYSSYKKITIDNAKFVRDTIKEMLPMIKKAFDSADLSSLRHEIDHVDFFSSPIYLDYYSKYIKAAKLGQRLHAKKDKSTSIEYALANMEVLKSMAEVSPLLEIRALFFNYVEPNEWSKVDFNNIKKKVYGNLISGYIEGGFPEEILDKLVSVEWSEDRMDRQTSNYLFDLVNKQRGSPNTLRYVVHPEQVNYSVANYIMYKELPEWKNRFATNGKTIVDIISNAYKNNPSKLKEANKARTFQEFIELCES